MNRSATTAVEAVAKAQDRVVEISWGDGTLNRYHYVWLRHHARCIGGMPNDTRVKIDLLPNEPSSLVVVGCDIDGEALVIHWQDDALCTRHKLATLRACAYDDEARQRRKHHSRLWDAQDAEAIPVFDFAAIDDDNELLQLMLALRDYGIARLIRVPIVPGSLTKVAQKFGPVHVNNYGDVFDVRSDAKLNLGSNTGDRLPPHTDESYRHDAPGISFFHCLQAAPVGGDSILVDGFMAAQRLRECNPSSFEVLTSVPVFFQRYAPPLEDMRSHTRMLVTDVDGDVVGCRWTDRTLPPQDLPPHRVEPVYRAIHALWKIVNDESMQFCYRMQPGNLHLFDNHRVLHGRHAFDASRGGRHLQQCSVNRDEFHNRLRLLAARLGDPASELVMAGGAVG